VVLASPPVRSALKGAALVPEVIPSPVHLLSLLTPSPRRSHVQLADGDADLYRPRGLATAPAVVVVPGGNPEGKDDPRIVGFADAVARTGRRVLVPQLGLRNQRLDLADLLRIREAVSLLAANHAKVGILAFSYGAGLTLVALAEQPEVQRHVAFVATIGTYFSLFDLLEGATTGAVPYDGRLVAWQPDPQALPLAAQQLAALLGGADGPALAQAWSTKDPAGLSSNAAAVYDLLTNHDAGRFAALVARLPPSLTALLVRLSPQAAAGRIGVPVFALHARTDAASPPTESRLLVAALRHRVRTQLVVVGNLSHVSPTVSVVRDVGDAIRMARFASAALRAQEGWPRP
jgi:pimeloyl-ACP methyl ester carboxylesterase